jgi:hypothetical protein
LERLKNNADREYKGKMLSIAKSMPLTCVASLQDIEKLDTKARKWHSDLLVKKEALESKRKERIASITQTMDKIAREEIEVFKEMKDNANPEKRKFDFDMPVINIKENGQEYINYF